MSMPGIATGLGFNFMIPTRRSRNQKADEWKPELRLRILGCASSAESAIILEI